MDRKTLPNHKYSYIPKKSKKQIYEYLFKEGVLVVEKDAKIKRHPQLNIPNLHVMMTMKSLYSRKYVTENYNWKHQYFILNDNGIEYLRDYLHLPAQTMPSTFSNVKSNRTPKPDEEFGGDHRAGMGRGRVFERRNYE
ncbi:40S ribosomal protein S10, putative [Hepatocystis sp. ex Piliocolobus tephrosceles]|nr:40S ribosomal protein S10, putative [Hepatocystis sp. ex Piliocolobus tephrosceles]